MQGVAVRKRQPELPGPYLELTSDPRLAANLLVTGLHRQAKLAPLSAQLTLRQRGVDTTPVDICYGKSPSAFGDCLLAWTERGICWLEFHPDSQSLPNLEHIWSPGRLIQDAATAARQGRDIFGSAGEGVPLHLCGTAFQLQVWSALLRIRPGCYLSYGDLARAIGMPRAARAMGQAVGANNVALLVPCHRVLAEGGRLGGYSGGLNLKYAILQHEVAIAAHSGRQSR